MMRSDLCAVVLAGGRSRRMGFDKALLRIGDRPVIQRIVECALALTDQVVISSNDTSSYQFLGRPVIEDVFTAQGPLAGLHAAMVQSSQSLFLLLACDMPNLHQKLLRTLVEAAEGFDAVLPRSADGGIHPLCAVYRKTCRPVIERNLRQKANKVTDIFVASALQVRFLEGEEGGFSDWDLVNLNSPEDLSAYRAGRPIA